eukprot:2890792-Rhodomonas_salina.1
MCRVLLRPPLYVSCAVSGEWYWDSVWRAASGTEIVYGAQEPQSHVAASQTLGSSPLSHYAQLRTPRYPPTP